MTLTLIAAYVDYEYGRRGQKKQVITGFRFIDENNEIVNDTKENVIKAFRRQEKTFSGIENPIDNYAKMNKSGILLGKSPLVILKESVNDVYIVVDYTGRLEKMSADAIERYSLQDGIANAKVNPSLKPRIVNLKGEPFPKSADYKAASEGGRKMRLMASVFDSKPFDTDDSGMASKNSSTRDLDKLSLGRGVNGVRAGGFANMKFSSVVMSNTCINFCDSCFMNCKNLKTVKIPEGTVNIPSRMFSGCTSLEEVELPNSLRTIGAFAFQGCVKLKTIKTGPIKPRYESGAIPARARLVPRR